MPIIIDRHDLEESRRRQLLALHGVRRGLERFAARDTAVWSAPVALIRTQLVGELQELIAALDRRLPQVARAGEASIARDAAPLKVKALKRIAELEGHDSLSGSTAAPAHKSTTAR
jgi:hypothetical protein